MNKRSAGSFCSLVAATLNGTSNSLESQDVAALGPGAQCYVLANRAVYAYDSGSSQTNIVGSDAFVQPLSGGGCWLKLNAQGAYSTLIQLAIGGVGGTLTSTGVWQAFPTGSAAYGISNNPMFTVDTTTGIITYNGPSGKHFLMMSTLTLASVSASGVAISLDMTINGALIGSSTLQQSLVRRTQTLSGQTEELVHNFQSALATGQTFQPVLLVTGTAATQNFQRYQLSILNID